MNLYKLSHQYEALFASLEVDEETGELMNIDTLQELEAISAEFDEKAENIALHIKNTEALEDAIKDEEKALKARREALENKSAWFRKYLHSRMEALGKDKLETSKCRISFRSSTSVHIEDEKALPPAFVSVVETVKPDKKAIKEAIQGGAEVKGAWLVTNRNIQIK